MELKVGSRYRSRVGSTEVIVIRYTAGHGELSCGGYPMVDHNDSPVPVEAVAGLDSATSVGKRYVDQEETLELLVTRGGTGTLTFDGLPLVIKQAKPLPSSD
jgi:hypothetical protein